MRIVFLLRESRNERCGSVKVRVLRLFNPPRSVGHLVVEYLPAHCSYSVKLLNRTNFNHREIPGTLPCSCTAFSQAFTVS